jgi:DNA-binding beta-propeller fold protein YncE
VPQLRKLERKYARELVVIGVHSAKFPSEKDTQAVRHAVERLSVGHPVVNDRDFRVWKEYTARAWPTLMFIDPRGKIIGLHEGEFTLEAMDRLLGDLIAQYDKEGVLDRRPLSFTAAKERGPDRPLYFPGKVLADPSGTRLFVSDTGHHRVLILSLDPPGIAQVFGSGGAGLNDGPASSARFNGPQGLALVDNRLFVADTENHALRRIDLASGHVETIAGTGEQGRFRQQGAARQVALNSPWDVAFADNRLYVAMAGSHQIWCLDLLEDTIRPWAGTGQENIADGPRAAALFAQPSGLALDERRGMLYVADSEVSGIRAVELKDGGQVRTLVGRGLFEFGDVDGVGDEVRLQHPLGLALKNGFLYVADSYNHKIKRLDPRTREVVTVLGSGQPGLRDGAAAEAQLSEPGGLSWASGKLFIADTNNHAVRVWDEDARVIATHSV